MLRSSTSTLAGPRALDIVRIYSQPDEAALEAIKVLGQNVRSSANGAWWSQAYHDRLLACLQAIDAARGVRLCVTPGRLSDARTVHFTVFRKARSVAAQTAPVEGVPPWAHASLFRWLAPILRSVQDAQHDNLSGTPSTAFLMLAERRLQLTVDWSNGRHRAIEDLAERMAADHELFRRVLELAIEPGNIDLGYSFQNQTQALTELDRILTEAGSVWRLDIQRVETGEQWHGRPTFREIRTLQRRTLPGTVNALQFLNLSTPDAARHLGSAWNHAFGRNPDPGRAYSEAIKAVEAAAIPVVSPKDPTATLGKVIGQLRSTPQNWQVVLTTNVTLPAGSQVAPIEVITQLAALLWANQTDRHAPVHPIQQAQAEMAVHLALLFVQVFTQSVSLASL